MPIKVTDLKRGDDFMTPDKEDIFFIVVRAIETTDPKIRRFVVTRGIKPGNFTMDLPADGVVYKTLAELKK
jgi:hypothetical protein